MGPKPAKLVDYPTSLQTGHHTTLSQAQFCLNCKTAMYFLIKQDLQILFIESDVDHTQLAFLLQYLWEPLDHQDQPQTWQTV